MSHDDEQREATALGRGLRSILVIWALALGVWVIAWHWESILLTIARAIVFVPDSVWVILLLLTIAYLVIISLRWRLDTTPDEGVELPHDNDR